jgi:hypothetical protein
MKNIFIKNFLYSLLIAISLLSLAPTIAGAQANCVGDCVNQGLRSSGISVLFPNGGLFGSLNQGPVGFIAFIIRILLYLAGMIAVLFVIIGGYQYITSSGNEEQAEKGRKTLVNAIIGIVIIVLSYVIINVIVNLVSGTGGGFLGF